MSNSNRCDKKEKCGIERSLRRFVKGLIPYAPGSFSASERAVRISANENNFGACPAVVDAIHRFLTEGEGLCRYPDITCTELREALSKKHDLPKDSFIVTNGLDDMITTLAMTFINEGDEVIVPAMTFGVYASTCSILGAVPIAIPMTESLDIDVDKVIAAITDRTKLIWLCTPNNPTGASLSDRDLARIVAAARDRSPAPIAVVDHAYADFSDSASDADGFSHVRQGENVIAMRTMSKLSGLAALRLGYAAAVPDIISCMYRVRPPYTANAIAQTAALADILLPEAEEHRSRATASIRSSRAKLEEFLSSMGARFVKSSANFVFAFYDRSVDEIKSIAKSLADEEIYVRTLIHSGAPSGLRISIGTEDENERLLDALGRIMA